MFVRAYLRASTNQQDASRAKEQLKAFAAERNLTVAAWYVENESGASLQRPALLDLLLEQVDRLSRLDEKDWDTLKTTLKEKEIRVVAQDLPTSWMMAVSDPTTARMFASINDMMLDMLAAIARKDYEDRRRRAAQGIEKAKAKGAYKGRKEDTERNALIQRHLKAGQSSWKEIMELVGCSRGTVAKQAELLKASQAAA
jgi:DNA invertase Pin-like site-specific DNA recombinase